MRLFIPELGTLLRLTADWTFSLHRESRNMEVWNMLGDGVTAPLISAWNEKLAVIDEEQRLFQEANFHEVMVSYGAWSRGGRLVSRVKPGFQKAWEELCERRSKHQYLNAVAPVTLPAGTVLNVDRIYIRKGAADFSSVSFFISETSHPNLTRDKKAKGFKKGRKRFWAKLADVNTIQFDQIETPVKEAA